MAIEDLNLEFEDEEESEKSDALSLDVDLSFSASAEPKSNKAANKVVGHATSMSSEEATDPKIKLPKTHAPQVKTTANTASKPTAKPTQMPMAKAATVRSNSVSTQNRPKAASVSNIADHPTRASQPAVSSTSQAISQAKVVAQSVEQTQETEDYQSELEFLRSEIAEMKKEMHDIRKQADIKVAVAEAKTEFMLEYITDAKLMDHQINQALQRIYQKAPALKAEVLSVKKFLTEFIEKTTKKK